jgi:hypothetical protein
VDDASVVKNTAQRRSVLVEGSDVWPKCKYVVAQDWCYKEDQKSMSNSDTRKVSCIIDQLLTVAVGEQTASNTN